MMSKLRPYNHPSTSWCHYILWFVGYFYMFWHLFKWSAVVWCSVKQCIFTVYNIMSDFHVLCYTVNKKSNINLAYKIIFLITKTKLMIYTELQSIRFLLVAVKNSGKNPRPCYYIGSPLPRWTSSWCDWLRLTVSFGSLCWHIC